MMNLPFFIIMATILFLSLIFNSLIVLTVIRIRNVQNAFNYIMVNMAIADILLTLSMIYTILKVSDLLPVTSLPLLYISICKTSHFLAWLAISVVAWTNVAIGYHRYIRMLSPIWRRRATKVHVKRIMLIIWIMSIIIMLVRLFIYISGHHLRQTTPNSLSQSSRHHSANTVNNNQSNFNNGSYNNVTDNTSRNHHITSIMLSPTVAIAIQANIQRILCDCVKFDQSTQYDVAKYLTLTSIILSYCIPFILTFIIYTTLGYRLWIIFTGRRKGIKPRIIQNLARYRRNTTTLVILFTAAGTVCILPLAIYELWQATLITSDNTIFRNVAIAFVVTYPFINSLITIFITKHSKSYLLAACGCARFSRHSITNASFATSRQHLKSNNISLRSMTATAS